MLSNVFVKGSVQETLVIPLKTLMSSAKARILVEPEAHKYISLIKIKNKKGPKTLP